MKAGSHNKTQRVKLTQNGPLDLTAQRVVDDIVEYKFYKKPVTAQYLILSRSTLPTKIK